MPVIATCLCPCVRQNDISSQSRAQKVKFQIRLLTNMLSCAPKHSHIPEGAKDIEDEKKRHMNAGTWLCSVEPLEPSFQADKRSF